MNWKKVIETVSKNMKDIRTIIRELGRVILDGAKVPHILSNPVIF